MTVDQYNDMLKAIEVQWPECPLIKELRTGYSSVNLLYMNHCVEEMSKMTKKVSKSNDDGNIDLSAYERMLMMEKSNLFKERARLSNQFHQTEDINTWCDISKKIGIVQNRIEEINKKTRALKNGEQVSTTKETYDLQEMDGIALIKQLNVARVQVSKKKAELNVLFQRIGDPDHPDIQKLNVKISEYENQKQKIEYEIKQREGAQATC